jgi:tRNA(Ile)-lysidine synthase
MEALFFPPLCAPIMARKGLDEVSLSLSINLPSALGKLLAQHADLTPEVPALIGVSGGRDSVVLLHALLKQGWSGLVVCHLNHSLRGQDSDQDADFVQHLAAQAGVPFEHQKVDVQIVAEKRRISLELAAREVREQFFSSVASRVGTRFVFLAHHADDQAETILGNLCRGTALRGMRGMDSSADTVGGLVKLRPLLQVTRAEVDHYVEAHDLKFREDASNATGDFRRNRLRHEVLPLLNEVFARDVSETLVRAGGVAARDDAYLQQQALDFIEGQQLLLPGGGLKITPELQGLHAAIQSRVIDVWLRRINQAQGVGNFELELAMSMLAPQGPAKINLPGNRWLRRRSKRLFVEHGTMSL